MDEKVNKVKDGNSKEKTTLRITGMTCAACSGAVERSLRKVEGVDFAAVNLATETALVVHDENVIWEDLKKAVEKVGYGVSDELPEEIDRARYLNSRKNLSLALVVTVPLMVLMLFHMAGYHLPWFPTLELVAAGFVVFYVGRGSIKGAWVAVTHFHTNMDTLISVGAASAWATTLLHVLGVPIASFGSIGAMIVALHISGRFIESSLRDKAAKDQELLKLSRRARAVIDGKRSGCPLKPSKGMTVKTGPGDRVPSTASPSGRSSVDESMITGNPSRPQGKGRIRNGWVVEPDRGIAHRRDQDRRGHFPLENGLLAGSPGFQDTYPGVGRRRNEGVRPRRHGPRRNRRGLWYFFSTGSTPWSLRPGPTSLGPSDRGAGSLRSSSSWPPWSSPAPAPWGWRRPWRSWLGRAWRRAATDQNAEAIQTTKDIGVVMMDKTGTMTEGNPSVTFHNLSPRTRRRRRHREELGSPAGQGDHGFRRRRPSAIEDMEEIAGKGVSGWSTAPGTR